MSEGGTPLHPEEEKVFVSLGSNIADRLQNIRIAGQHLAASEAIGIIDFSSIYETEPVGAIRQDLFLNQVIELQTSMQPMVLLDFLLSIERTMGRVRAEKWGPRIIDLDIIFWDRRELSGERLRIPHPHVRERRFVLEPLCEIAADFVTPFADKTAGLLLEQCRDSHAVTMYLPKTQLDLLPERS